MRVIDIVAVKGKRRWDEAAALFARIGDAPAEALRRRCEKFKAEAPPADGPGPT